MTDDIERSKKGFAFTAVAVDYMAKWSETLRQHNAVAVWHVKIGPANEIHTLLAGDWKHRLLAPFVHEDSVRDIQFYWAAEEHALAILREFCIDAGDERPNCVIPLTPEQLHRQ